MVLLGFSSRSVRRSHPLLTFSFRSQQPHFGTDLLTFSGSCIVALQRLSATRPSWRRQVDVVGSALRCTSASEALPAAPICSASCSASSWLSSHSRSSASPVAARTETMKPAAVAVAPVSATARYVCGPSELCNSRASPWM